MKGLVNKAKKENIVNAKCHVIIGNEGVSRYFMLGLLDVADPAVLEKELNALRAKLIDDPYFKGLTSMQIQTNKTAVFFHSYRGGLLWQKN